MLPLLPPTTWNAVVEFAWLLLIVRGRNECLLDISKKAKSRDTHQYNENGG